MFTTANNPIPQSQIRTPRGFVSINNQQVLWERIELSNTRYSAAGTYKVIIPANTLPNTISLSDLISTSPITVKINAGLTTQSVPSNTTPSDLPTLMLGDADDIIFNPAKTELIISGRDYISRFLDNKLNQLNNPIGAQIQSILSASTSSQIISLLATNRGLTPHVIATSNPIGIYLAGGQSSGYSSLGSQITEWDLMVYLAREENYDLFVQGLNLYFQPRNSINNYQLTLTVPYFSTPGKIVTSNVMDIQLSRSLRLAKNVVVQVTSWNVQDKTSYTQIATLSHLGSANTKDQLIYNYRFPNLSLAQCQQKANSLLAEISQHEMQLSVRMPADTVVTAQSSIIVKDTNSLFDQTYFVKNVTRELDFNGGFIMHIEAKTTPPHTVTLQQ